MKGKAGKLFFLSYLLLHSAAILGAGKLKDEGAFFRPETARQLKTQISALFKDTKRSIIIETRKTVPTKSDQEFTDWVGKRYANIPNESLLILLVQEPSYIVITASPDVRDFEFTNEDRARLTQLLVHHFSRRETDLGMVLGLKYVDHLLRNRILGAQLVLPSIPNEAKAPVVPVASNQNPLVSAILWSGLLLLVLLFVLVTRSIFKGLKEQSPAGA